MLVAVSTIRTLGVDGSNVGKHWQLVCLVYTYLSFLLDVNHRRNNAPTFRIKKYKLLMVKCTCS